MSKRRVTFQITLDLRAVVLLSVVLLLLGLIVAPTVAGAFPRSDDPEPLYDAKNADKVDGLHASKRPKANTLLALDKNKKFPNGVIPGAITRDKEVMRIVKKNDGPDSGLDADLLDGKHGSYYLDLVPSGAVMFFNLDTCPSRWHELTEARGRYLVGLTAGGTISGTVGIALKNRENRPVGLHGHSLSDPGHKHSISDPKHAHDMQHYYAVSGSSYGDKNGKPYYLKWSTSDTEKSKTGISIKSHTTGISIYAAGPVKGTNAPYIQLLVCVKD